MYGLLQAKIRRLPPLPANNRGGTAPRSDCRRDRRSIDDKGRTNSLAEPRPAEQNWALRWAQRLTRTWTSPDASRTATTSLAPSRLRLKSPGFCDLRFETDIEPARTLRKSPPAHAQRSRDPCRPSSDARASGAGPSAGIQRVDPALDRVSGGFIRPAACDPHNQRGGRVCDDIVKLHHKTGAGSILNKSWLVKLGKLLSMSEAAGLTKPYRHSLCETERTRSIVSARRQRSHRSAAETPVQPIPGDIDSDEMSMPRPCACDSPGGLGNGSGCKNQRMGRGLFPTKDRSGRPSATAAPTQPPALRCT